MAEPVIDLRSVCKSYGEQVVTDVLRSVDLRVERGEFVALIGPSGSEHVELDMTVICQLLPWSLPAVPRTTQAT
jgi:ABC-type transporter Mla maintaining outer membrane lipid asymmetry ATPase subunit MlaF